MTVGRLGSDAYTKVEGTVLTLGEKLGEGEIGCMYSAKFRSQITFGIPDCRFVMRFTKPEFCALALARDFGMFGGQLYRRHSSVRCSLELWLFKIDSTRVFS